MNRQELLNELNGFYNQKGIINDENFNCCNKDVCCSYGIDLAQGMQCHIGTKYTEREKVLVVSLDCGGGGKQNITERTKTIEKLIVEIIINPHMRGTIRCISDFYEMGENNKEALRYYAMTNSCKCTRKSDSMDKLPWRFYEKCADLKKEEIKIIDPDVIYFQGKDSLINCQFTDIPSVNDSLKEFIKFLVIDDRKYVSVICIHPSARGRNAKKRKDFYDNKIVEINRFIRENLLNKIV